MKKKTVVMTIDIGELIQVIVIGLVGIAIMYFAKADISFYSDADKAKITAAQQYQSTYGNKMPASAKNQK